MKRLLGLGLLLTLVACSSSSTGPGGEGSGSGSGTSDKDGGNVKDAGRSGGGTKDSGKAKDGAGHSTVSDGSSSGKGLVKFACNYSNGCQITMIPASDVAGSTSSCESTFPTATVVTSCPTGGLLGCCAVTEGAAEEMCYYNSDTAKAAEANCSNTGGNWSSTIVNLGW
jgi:hypothetical protein